MLLLCLLGLMIQQLLERAVPLWLDLQAISMKRVAWTVIHGLAMEGMEWNWPTPDQRSPHQMLSI